MSRKPYDATPADLRDRAADDRDEVAWQRDRASSARDRAADARDEQAEARLHDARGYVDLTRRQLEAASQEPGEDQHVARDLLAYLEGSLADAERDRRAATGDRQAAAADRDHSAGDRAVEAGHRGQAAIERAQQPGGESISRERWAELYAHALAARSRAASGRVREFAEATPPDRDELQRPELARLRSMRMIEQAKAIIMTRSGCGEAEAFDYLRQASQQQNVPVHDLASQIVTNLGGNRPRTGQDS